MPYVLDIRCPKCQGRASFEFAVVRRIGKRRDIEFFRESPLFEYQTFQDSCGHKWHAAIFIARLHGGSTAMLKNLPNGYAAEDWENSKYRSERFGFMLGGYACHSCHVVLRHELEWPHDAFYQVDYRGDTLWAFHRESAVSLLEYLSATQRDASRHSWSSMLMKVPKQFQVASAREPLVKKLGAMLAV